MPAVATEAVSSRIEKEIQRFVECTARHSSPSLYRNRRSSTRLHRSWPMFVTRLDGGDTPDASVTLYNVSSGGVAFYSDSGYPVGAVLGIKLFWSDPDAPRVPAIVRHTQITMQGMLVGAEFVLNDRQACDLVNREGRGWYG